jgi:quinol monooxygenase YgiN
MAPVGFLVELEALPGREEALSEFLTEARMLVDDEPGTLLWFAFRRGPSSFAIFDVFASEEARDVHLHGEVRRAMEERGRALFSARPVITPVDVIDAKVPSPIHRPQ